MIAMVTSLLFFQHKASETNYVSKTSSRHPLVSYSDLFPDIYMWQEAKCSL